MNFSTQDLQSLQIWVSSAILEDGRKLPISPKTGKAAKSNTPDTWTDYKTAAEYAAAHGQSVGLMLPPDGTLPDDYCLVFVDLDGHKEGQPTRPAMKIYDVLNVRTYGETSISGTGYHFYGLVRRAAILAELGGKNYGDVFSSKQDNIDAEIYISGFTNRYAIYTGKSLRFIPSPLQDITEDILGILWRYFPREHAQQPAAAPQRPSERKSQSSNKNTHPKQENAPESAQRPQKWLDTALLNDRFRSFYSDGIAPQDCSGSESQADMSFLYLLARFTQQDAAEMKAAFLSSAWMKQKDSKHTRKANRRDYLDRSIARAIQYSEHAPIQNKKIPFTKDALGAWLEEHNLHFRYNLIKHNVDIPEGLLDDFIPEEVRNGHYVDELHSRLVGSYSQCNTGDIQAYTVLIAAADSYNPVLERLAAAPEWDGVDRIKYLCDDCMQLDPEDSLSRIMIHKWLLQTIAIQDNSIAHPMKLDGILVLYGKQGFGKTTLCRKLAWNDLSLFNEGAKLHFREKDTLIQSTSYFITELGELSRTTKGDADALKAFITDTSDEYRPPYGRTSKKFPRLTSFVGTVNDDRFLCDPTGNRRFWTVICPHRFNLDSIANLDTTQLWKQVQREYEESENPRSCFIFTPEEQALLEERNAGYTRMSGLDEVMDILGDAEEHPADYEIRNVTVTAWKNYYPTSIRSYTAPQIGQCLKSLGYTTKTVRGSIGDDGKVTKSPRKAYNLPIPIHYIP